VESLLLNKSKVEIILLGKKKMTYKTKYRILEMIPGIVLWGAFILAISLSFLKPLWIIYFIIVYDFFWFLRIFNFVIYIFASHKKLKEVDGINWFSKVKKTDGWDDLYHVVLMPAYKEPYKVLRDSLQGLVDADYDSKKFIVIISKEERSGKEQLEQYEKDKADLQEKYSHFFKDLIFYIHPSDIPGELPGKGSNDTWAAKKFTKEYVDPQNIPHEKIIISTFDVDTFVYPQYFSRLTYLWLKAEDPHRHSYQPLALYNNNIWDAPPFARVIAYSTTFWHLTEKAKPDRLLTFTSHAMSFKTLVDVGYWENDIVTEDSRIFLQCFDKYDGDYSTIPMYVPISMDTVMSSNLKETAKGQYRQMRRWAWSVEHFPWMIIHFARNKKISFFKKFKYLFNQFEGQFSWATAPIFMFVLGQLPFLVAANKGLKEAVVQNGPFILSLLMTFSMVGIVICTVFSFRFIPKRPENKNRFDAFVMIIQWMLVPFTMIAFGSVPDMDAQTRLLLGGKFRLGFDVTEKHRK
jgi:hypothetical protein